jgi:pimeloyl-ACP methyl ester carboxylesterase
MTKRPNDVSQHKVHAFDRVPLILSFAEKLAAVETYGFVGSQGMTFLEGQLLIPRGVKAHTLFLFMHPASTLQLLPMPRALAEAGLHVLCAGSRYAKNDSALIMEKVVFDLGAYIRHAKEILGYRKVVLVGWSGGGSLSLYYQSQAEQPSVTHTPAGDPYDLTQAGLIPADGIIFIAAHLSRAETLTEWLDPSVTDEADPDTRDPELDIYDPDCPNQPPFSAEFIDRFRDAQRARSARITRFAEEWLARLRERDNGEVERSFIVHRTMCDPRWIDPAIDPNGRPPGRCYLGDPRTANVGPAGIARYTSLRSWLSQWSIDRTFSRGPENARRIARVPIFQIVNEADDAVPATHNRTIASALTSTARRDHEYVEIYGATHYYLGQDDKLATCIDHVLRWSDERGFA